VDPYAAKDPFKPELAWQDIAQPYVKPVNQRKRELKAKEMTYLTG